MPINQICGAKEAANVCSGDGLHMTRFSFTSTCPRCQREQHQGGFSRGSVQRLLEKGLPIEGYCLMCDQFWPVGAPERAELAKAVSSL